MPPISEPNAANVFAGPCAIYLGPKGSIPPSLATEPDAAAWLAAGFRRAGYTEAGAEVGTSPDVKKFTPDEAISPIKITINGVAGSIKFTLWETHSENLETAMSLSVLTKDNNTGRKVLGVGSGNALKEWVIGLQGPSVDGPESRVVVGWRGIVTSAISLGMQRKDISKLACTFELLTDSNQDPGEDVFKVVDFGAGS